MVWYRSRREERKAAVAMPVAVLAAAVRVAATAAALAVAMAAVASVVERRSMRRIRCTGSACTGNPKFSNC